MNVMHARGKSDHLALLDCRRQMMSVVLKTLSYELWIKRVVEDPWRDVVKNCLIDDVYSARSTSSGSTRIARRAGPIEALKATPMSNTPTVVAANGPDASQPKTFD
jgi:hypothetical protein